MRNVKGLLLGAILTIALCTTAFGQGIPVDTVKNFVDWWNNTFGWHESIATLTCMNGKYFWVTYVVYNDGTTTNIPVHITATGEDCSCKVNQSTAPAMTSSPSPRDSSEDCHHSGINLQGEGAAIAGAGEGPNQVSHPMLSGTLPARVGRPTTGSEKPLAAPGSTAFDYTLPFRALPAAPILTPALGQVPWVCNSKVNPSMYVIDHVGNIVTRVNMCTGAPLATTNVAQLPLQVRVTPDGAQAIVTSYQNAISFIDTNTNQVTNVIQTDPSFTPPGVAISPDGSFALVTNYEQPPDAFMAVVDIASKKITGNIPLSTEFPQSVFISPDGTLAWVTYPFDNVVDVIDIMTGVTVRRFGSIAEPLSIAFNPTGTVAYVSSGAGSVQVIDTAGYTTIASIPADQGASDLVVTPDEAFVLLSNSAAQSVTLINIQALKGITSPVGGTPYGAVLVPTQ